MDRSTPHTNSLQDREHTQSIRFSFFLSFNWAIHISKLTERSSRLSYIVTSVFMVEYQCAFTSYTSPYVQTTYPNACKTVLAVLMVIQKETDKRTRNTREPRSLGNGPSRSNSPQQCCLFWNKPLHLPKEYVQFTICSPSFSNALFP